jgi:glycosyltransferase involved in cell wall biosynthesis
MPAFNSENYVAAAINSILSQSFSDFEFIIIDDGSTDNTNTIIKSIKDKRIVLIENKVNKGLVYSLNIGLKTASKKYIVRMDADDIAYSERLSIQFKFMEDNPEVSIAGSYMQTFGVREEVWKGGETYPKVFAKLFFESPLFHPTIIGRSHVLKKAGYDPYFKAAEDYDIWFRLLKDGHHVVVIPKILLRYRTHTENFGTYMKSEKLKFAQELREKAIGLYLEGLLEEEVIAFRDFISFKADNNQIKVLKSIFLKLAKSIKDNHPIIYKSFKTETRYQWRFRLEKTSVSFLNKCYGPYSFVYGFFYSVKDLFRRIN